MTALAVDDASGTVYALDGVKEAIDRFDPEGHPQSFPAGSAAGKSSLLGPGSPGPNLFKEQERFFFGGLTGLAVDNSGGAGGGEQGRLYVSGGAGPIDAFKPNGEYLWALPAATIKPCGIAVDPEGHLWVTSGEEVREFANSGSPPAEIPAGKFKVSTGNKNPCELGIDHSGAGRYVTLTWPLGSNSEKAAYKYLGGTLESTLTALPTRGVAVNQSTTLPSASLAGHIFAVEDPTTEGYNDLRSVFSEYEPCSLPGCVSPSLGTFGANLIGDGRGIAYNPTSDRVYVSDLYAERVAVFGPRASGTVPDVTMGSPSVGPTAVTLTGTINPQSVPNTYHFEVKPLINEAQAVTVEAGFGHFKLLIEGEATAPILYNASAEEVQSALEGLSGIGKANVTVTGGREPGHETGEGIARYTVTFVGALQATNVPLFAGDSSELQGGAKGGRVQISFGQLAQGLSSWAAARSAPASTPYPGISPTDSKDHTISAVITGLQGNKSYMARLVATNTEPGKDLNAYSPPLAFKTAPPPPPAVENLKITSVTTGSAQIEATVDPREDTTTWKILRSPQPDATQAECEALEASKFVTVGEGTIPSGTVGTVDVETSASGLLPGETNCVRVVAVNGNPIPGSADQVFRTTAVAPTEAETAFAAPRTDTTARINGYVNPQGDAPFKYRFEVSSDGVSWTARPERESNVNGREQIVVSDELSGLTPDTTYYYRLASVENEGGATAGSGEATFTTRTAAEAQPPAGCPNAQVRAAQRTAYLPDCRGVELVNQPDKGNQDVLDNAFGAFLGAKSPQTLSADGEAALWRVFSPAPGGNSSGGPVFLSRRSSAGWVSHGLLPPPAEQIGGGDMAYALQAVTPDFSTAVMQGQVLVSLGGGPLMLTRSRAGASQELLNEKDASQSSFEVSEDARHVIEFNGDTGELEDFGTPGRPLLVSVMPDGSPDECHKEIEFGTSRAGYAAIDMADASRVYFLSPANGDCAGPTGLYERNVQAGTTTPIDPGVDGAEILFVRATPDGRAAYFVTSSKLDPADTNSHFDLYRFDEQTGESSCLTCVVPDASLRHSVTSEGPESVIVSDDFSRIYFVSGQRLVAGRGKSGEANIYLLQDGRLSFVATGDPQEQLAPSLAGVSADGNVLMFATVARPGLTSDAMARQCIEPNGGTGSCEELYRYEASTGSLECVSCVRGGVTTHSWRGQKAGPQQGLTGEFGLSSDGSTVVFPTVQALVPGDVNGGSDLYEWRDGVVGLITDGVTRFNAGFANPSVAGVDAHGANILFSVADPGLTGFEQDGLANLYDARIGGGFIPPAPSVPGPEECGRGRCRPARRSRSRTACRSPVRATCWHSPCPSPR